MVPPMQVSCVQGDETTKKYLTTHPKMWFELLFDLATVVVVIFCRELSARYLQNYWSLFSQEFVVAKIKLKGAAFKTSQVRHSKMLPWSKDFYKLYAVHENSTGSASPQTTPSVEEAFAPPPSDLEALLASIVRLLDAVARHVSVNMCQYVCHR